MCEEKKFDFFTEKAQKTVQKITDFDTSLGKSKKYNDFIGKIRSRQSFFMQSFWTMGIKKLNLPFCFIEDGDARFVSQHSTKPSSMQTCKIPEFNCTASTFKSQFSHLLLCVSYLLFDLSTNKNLGLVCTSTNNFLLFPKRQQQQETRLSPQSHEYNFPVSKLLPNE
uniref:Uncharacterized protein n=1 Tax=Romanomermis culicivorax TaxID=13658 RepID=A0A915J8E5_ROMCU